MKPLEKLAKKFADDHWTQTWGPLRASKEALKLAEAAYKLGQKAGKKSCRRSCTGWC